MRPGTLREIRGATAIATTVALLSSCGGPAVGNGGPSAPSASASGASASAKPGAGASAEASANLTTVTSAVSGPAIQYQYIYSQSPDPNATDSKSVNAITLIEDTLNVTKDAKGILNWDKGAVSGLNAAGLLTAINSGITLLQFLGILPKPPDEVATLTREVSQVANGITWQDLQSYIDMNYGPVENATLVQVPEYGTSYNAAGRPGDDAASIGLTNLYADAAWQRAAVGSGSDS